MIGVAGRPEDSCALPQADELQVAAEGKMRSATQQAELIFRQAKLQRRVWALCRIAQGEAGALLHFGKGVMQLLRKPLQGVAPQVVLPLRIGH